MMEKNIFYFVLLAMAGLMSKELILIRLAGI